MDEKKSRDFAVRDMFALTLALISFIALVVSIFVYMFVVANPNNTMLWVVSVLGGILGIVAILTANFNTTISLVATFLIVILLMVLAGFWISERK